MSKNAHTLTSQQERIKQCEQGRAVVAREGRDTWLVSWARAGGRLAEVGAGTRWQNPHEPTIWRQSEQEASAKLYFEWLKTQPALLACVHELRGMVLLSSVYPWPDNAGILCEMANHEGAVPAQATRRSNAAKRREITIALSANPLWSDHSIGRELN